MTGCDFYKSDSFRIWRRCDVYQNLISLNTFSYNIPIVTDRERQEMDEHKLAEKWLFWEECKDGNSGMLAVLKTGGHRRNWQAMDDRWPELRYSDESKYSKVRSVSVSLTRPDNEWRDVWVFIWGWWWAGAGVVIQ